MKLTEKQLKMWVTMLRANSKINRRLAADMLAENGMPIVWFDVLVQLFHAPNQMLRMNELADQVIMSGSGLTRLIDRMIKEGLVNRTTCASDRRVVHVMITELGRLRISEVLPAHQKRVYEYFIQHLKPEEIETIQHACQRVLDNCAKCR